ncbi:MAG: SurA N-terminal domain-containing protein, partial [Calditrichia bacterium]|nr:SurA N-terminal domain-containing protein [Calditrichia bacterium]
MMTKIRQMSWLFLWVLIAAFIGMMVVEWGAGGIQRDMNVGKIDGKNVKLEVYEKQLAQVRENLRQGDASLDDALLKRSHEQTWTGMIEQVVMNKYINKYNINISPEEVQNYIMNVPAEQLKQYPQLQTNGVFDIEKYRMAVQNDQNLFTSLYNYYKQNLPLMKLQEVVSKGAVVTEAEVLNDYIMKNIKADAEFLFVPSSAFSKKVGEVSDDEALAYYSAHKDEFKQEEQRIVSYVEFPVVTSAIDSERVHNEVEGIIKQLKRGEKFEDIAPIYSDDPSVEKNNGDLGFNFLDGYVKEFREAAESAKIGDIVGPVKTQFGIHVLQVIKRNKEKNKSGKLSVKAHVKHILLKFEASPDTRDQIYRNAENLSENAMK